MEKHKVIGKRGSHDVLADTRGSIEKKNTIIISPRSNNRSNLCEEEKYQSLTLSRQVVFHEERNKWQKIGDARAGTKSRD
jgi:hypothetical protein